MTSQNDVYLEAANLAIELRKRQRVDERHAVEAAWRALKRSASLPSGPYMEDVMRVLRDIEKGRTQATKPNPEAVRRAAEELKRLDD
jgi:hypothetical protein